MFTLTITYLAHSTLAIALAYAVQLALPSRRAACETVWRAAMLLPLLSAWMSTRPQAASPWVPGALGWTDVLHMSPVVISAGSTWWIPAAITGALTLGALRFVLAHRRMRHMLTSRTPAPTDVWVQLRRMCETMRQPIPRLCVSDRISSPLALPNEIVLPRDWAMACREAELHVALAHELAHIERRDPRWMQVYAALRWTLWFQPLLALAHRQVQDSAELACDAAAANIVGHRVCAESLFAMATHPLAHTCPRKRRLVGRPRQSHARKNPRAPARQAPSCVANGWLRERHGHHARAAWRGSIGLSPHRGRAPP